ncbi:helicostatins [Anopheles bellator]|uniref:helicostatins n=1 Tax=Anopheles bellator TaxID=139047 RepID=UPI00264949D9|nr:helicostatins [Anopheles bellator]
MRCHTWTPVLVAYMTLSACLSVSWSLPAGGSGSSSGTVGSSAGELDMDELTRDRGTPGQGEISTSQFQHMLAVRSPKYNFGLGKRRYIIEDVPGAKRLPHYNFGLGKRGSAALGGSDYEYDVGNQLGWNDNDYNLITKDGQFDYDGEKDGAKRGNTGNGPNRYHFGLGKRRTYDFGLGKRYFETDDFNKRLPNRYNFGLGKR